MMPVLLFEAAPQTGNKSPMTKSNSGVFCNEKSQFKLEEHTGRFLEEKIH